MKIEAEKGLPIVLLCHVPLYVPGLFEKNLSANERRCAYVCGAPDDKVAAFVQLDRVEQQKADKVTHEAVAYLKSLKLLKAVLAGHVHQYWQERFSGSAMQYVTSAVYKGAAQEIELV